MDRVASQVNQFVLKKSTRFIAALQASGFQVQSAYLYGSHAKGRARRDSDIDIAIVSKDLSGDWLDDYCRLTRIADRIDVRMEVIAFLPQDFHEQNPLVWEIKSFGISLIENVKHKRRAPIKPTRKRA